MHVALDRPEKLRDLGLAGEAYREIKRRIIERRYSPGEKLSEVRLAAELGLGRSPLRTALARLEAQGWIAVSPQSGTYVRGVSDQETRDILELRLVLEPYVAALSAQRIDLHEVASLRRSFDAFGRRPSPDRYNEYLELDFSVHAAVYRAGANPLMLEMLTNLIDKARWTSGGSADSPQRMQSSFEEICSVLDALERRDGDAASSRMREHIANTARFRGF